MGSNLVSAVQHPRLAVQKLNNLYHRRLNRRRYNENGVNVFEQDWDNLIVLDACRYDTFSENWSLTGDLSRKTSRGSSTIEFLRGNFAGRSLLDTVYITANPQLYHNFNSLSPELFDIVNVWREDGWDSETGTVLPETMNGRVDELQAEYPNKRYVIHYIQPHYPFIDSNTDFDKGHLSEKRTDEVNLWTKLMKNELSVPRNELYAHYESNLKRCIPHVEEIIDELDGKTVVTSDHGNLFNESMSPIPVRGWGHPLGIYVDELVKIPWFECPFENRRSIEKGSKKERYQIEDVGSVEERLRDLGYTA